LSANSLSSERDPTPPIEYGAEGAELTLEAFRPFIKGAGDDECEEEVDDESDIEAMLENAPNEYETEEQYAYNTAMTVSDDDDDDDDDDVDDDDDDDDMEDVEEEEVGDE